MNAPYDDRVELYPMLAQAAAKLGEAVDYVHYAVLRAFDVPGCGRVAYGSTVNRLVRWRGITPRAARRVLARLESRGYVTIANAHDAERVIYLRAAGKVMAARGVDREQRPHLVAMSDLRTPAAMRAQLHCLILELPDHSGRYSRGELTRSVKQQLTGNPPSTQRRYESATCYEPEPVYAQVLGLAAPARGSHGYFVDKQTGTVWRRLGDRVVPRDHLPGSQRSARRAASQARMELESREGPHLTRPTSCASQARGQRRSLPMRGGDLCRRFYRVSDAAAAARQLVQLRRHTRDPVHFAVGSQRFVEELAL